MASRSAVNHIDGDLLKLPPCIFKAHQCNCESTYSKGLANAVFRAHPHADTYAVEANYVRVTGTASLHGEIVNLYAQHSRGGVRVGESVAQRHAWFASALNDAHAKIVAFQRVNNNNNDGPHDCYSIAFPYLIGCGLAGGVWHDYKKLIETFAAEHPRVSVTIVRRAT